MPFLLYALMFLILSTPIYAANVMNTVTNNTASQNTTINSTHLGTAKDWNLTPIEWNHYLALMQGPSGLYYKNLSPPKILGINAENAEEMRHYAEISATMEHDRLESELRFDAAFHEAAQRLYQAEPIIKPFDYTPFTPIPKN